VTEDFDVHVSYLLSKLEEYILVLLVIFIYITRLATNEIFLPSNKINWEVSRAKDLSARRYISTGVLTSP